MSTKDDIVIVSDVRTPFSKFGGTLKQIHSTNLGVVVIKESLKRAGLRGEDIDELYYGMCDQVEVALYDNVNARQALLRAGLPNTLVSLTLDRACCSSLTAVHPSRRALLLHEAELCLAVGAENMNNTPLGKDAGEIAREHGLSRKEQDEWAQGSQGKWADADKAGRFRDELTPVDVPPQRGDPIIFDRDEFPKPDATLEKLSQLKTIYESPSVTAGNASGLDAGASAIILMKRSQAEERGIKQLAAILPAASGAGKPRPMAELPAQAARAL